MGIKGWSGGLRIFPGNPGSFGGSFQPAPCPRPAVPKKGSSMCCQQLAGTLALGPSSAGRGSAWLLPGANELGRREWPPHINQKLWAE